MGKTPYATYDLPPTSLVLEHGIRDTGLEMAGSRFKMRDGRDPEEVGMNPLAATTSDCPPFPAALKNKPVEKA